MKTTLKTIALGIAAVLTASAFSTGAFAATPSQREPVRAVQVQRHGQPMKRVSHFKHVSFHRHHHHGHRHFRRS
jgi:hypothetical protein